MTNTEIIKRLQEFPENTQVYLSIDEEGNGYNKVQDIEFYTGEEAEEFDVNQTELIVIWS